MQKSAFNSVLYNFWTYIRKRGKDFIKPSFSFYKYEATGNDFILVEGDVPSKEISKLCDRRYGIGADGLICLLPSNVASIKMVYYNCDGSRAGLCLNGVRTVATHLGKACTIETDCGIFQGDKEMVLCQKPLCLEKELILDGIQGSFYRAGVPHFVFKADFASMNFLELGEKLRFHPFFKAEGANVNGYEILSPTHWKCKTYERGVEKETASCGSGALCCFAHMGEKRGQVTFTSGNTLFFCEFNGQIKMEGRVRLNFYGMIPPFSATMTNFRMMKGEINVNWNSQGD